MMILLYHLQPHVFQALLKNLIFLQKKGKQRMGAFTSANESEKDTGFYGDDESIIESESTQTETGN